MTVNGLPKINTFYVATENSLPDRKSNFDVLIEDIVYITNIVETNSKTVEVEFYNICSSKKEQWYSALISKKLYTFLSYFKEYEMEQIKEEINLNQFYIATRNSQSTNKNDIVIFIKREPKRSYYNFIEYEIFNMTENIKYGWYIRSEFEESILKCFKKI